PPRQGHGPTIDNTHEIDDIRKQGLKTPVVIRFQDIIRHRVDELNEAFRRSIVEAGYKGKYQGVYPVKVNQMREVVEEILDAGVSYDFGLEAGSKAELAAVIAMETTPGSLIICNGYKDYNFVKTALMGLKLGKRVLIVVEKLSELYQVIGVSKELGVKPLIGIRSKLYTKGSGRWETSGGETAKFGLTTPELLHAVNVLKQAGLEDSFKLLHFHIGSQITNITTIKDAVKEASRIYAKLIKMGLKLEYIDVGGGLGVDYDGSRTNFASSINYTLSEYVEGVVYTIQEVCQAEEVPEPNIVSESGRALVAHHSVLVVDVFGSIEVGATPVAIEFAESESEVVEAMREIYKTVSHKNLAQAYHDAIEKKDEALSMFKLGILPLEDRAKVEHLFWLTCQQIFKLSKDLKYVPDEIQDLNKPLADQFLCNFSVFQSMLDHWAIDHLFPIMPLHRLAEQPAHDATLVDITCDSDGKISKFVDLRDISDTIRVHNLKEGEPYYLGFFLMGAYQDIMGDLHNLFGRVNEVHVFLDETEPGGYYVEEIIPGNNIAEVLSMTQYSAEYLKKRVKIQIDAKVREGEIKPREGVELQNFYEGVLHGYTYAQMEKGHTNGSALTVENGSVNGASGMATGTVSADAASTART
ncbi:MAG: biosynthetic arginine decarboxylase, partial [Bacteriovoracia bacterium]